MQIARMAWKLLFDFFLGAVDYVNNPYPQLDGQNGFVR